MPSRSCCLRLPRASLTLALLALVPLGCSGEAKPDRLDLIVISLDTCRADRLGCYGAPRATPGIDRLAREAVQFRDCLVQATLTAPSHLSLFTGHTEERHGMVSNRLRAEPPYTLASVLRHAGWRTAAFTGHGSLTAKHGLDFGFDTFQSWVGPPAAPFTRDLSEVVPHALEWLDAMEQEDVFLFVHAYDPHCPFWPPETYRTPPPPSTTFDPQATCHPSEFAGLITDGTIGEAEVRWIRELYDGEIASADAVLDSFLNALDERGRLDSSIVVFTSDHGEVLGNHGWIGHGCLWEEAQRVPLLIRFPEGRWAGSLDDPVQTVDVMPTLLSALGVDTPEGTQGIDLLSRIRGEGQAIPSDRLRVCKQGPYVSVRAGPRFKILFLDTGRRRVQRMLFDLEVDPGEETNLVDAPGGQERFRAILERYDAWRAAEAAGDRRFASRLTAQDPEDREAIEAMRALGYAGEDE